MPCSAINAIPKTMKFIKKEQKRLITSKIPVTRSCMMTWEKLTQDYGDVNLTVKLKAAITKKLRLKVTAYSKAEYLYTASSQGQIITFKSYNVKKESNIAASI